MQVHHAHRDMLRNFICNSEVLTAILYHCRPMKPTILPIQGTLARYMYRIAIAQTIVIIHPDSTGREAKEHLLRPNHLKQVAMEPFCQHVSPSIPLIPNIRGFGVNSSKRMTKLNQQAHDKHVEMTRVRA